MARARRKGSRNGGGLRLVSYARVSAVRGREGPGFISEVDQFSRNRAYADAYAHRIIEEGSDRDVSGGVMSRPIFDRFLAMISHGEADGIIVTKLDRFARSNVGALAAVEAIEDAGGTLISVSEQLDASTGAGRFLRTILFAAAQWERERIGEAWHTARNSAVERGIHVAPHVPPGYVRGPKTNDPKTDRRLKPHRKHARTIKRAFEMAVTGASHANIADYLNERQLPAMSIKRGEKATYWQSFRVSRLLSNRVYVGEARSGDFVNPDAHEPLVDEQTWLLAQRRPTNGRTLRRPNRNAKAPPSILSGIARCAGCSFAMKPQSAGKSSKAIYRCVTTSVHGRCESPSTIAKSRIEAYVIEQFLDQADAHFVGSEMNADRDAERQRLVREADDAERSYRLALTNIELRRQIGGEDHDALIAHLHADWRETVAKAEDAQSRAVHGVTLPNGVSLRELVTDLRGGGSNEELRSLLAEGIEAVFVRPAMSRAHDLPVADRVKIVWRGAEDLELPRRGRRFDPRAYVW